MSLKIAILSPKDENTAETFIKNHIRFLPFDKIVIYGGNVPYLEASNLPTKIDMHLFSLKNFLRRKLGAQSESFRLNRLKRILIKEQIDIVFAEYLITGAEAVEVCKSLNIPLLAIALGYEISQYEVLKIYESKYKKLFDYASYIIVVSEHMTKNLIKYGCPMDKIQYSPAGPHSDFFALKPKFTHKTAFAIGRFVDKKAPHITIKAFSKVVKKVKDSRLVMAGDGPLLWKCKELVKELGIDNKVDFLGPIDQAEQKRQLEDAFLFVQHSRVAENGDSEGTPVAILEASAAGLPIVSTLHAGIPKVVCQNKSGFLVAENDIDGMANSLISLFNAPQTAIDFGNFGRTYVGENFTLEKHIETLNSLIKSCE